MATDPDGPEGFAVQLRRRRLAAGLTQESLAVRAGLNVRGISDLERGLKAPQRATVQLLVRALALPPEEMRAFARAAEHGRARQGDGVRGAGPPAESLPVALALWPAELVGNTVEVARCLTGLSGVALLEGDPERAARLFAAARAKLGPAAVAAACDRGRAMPLGAALAESLDTDHAAATDDAT